MLVAMEEGTFSRYRKKKVSSSNGGRRNLRHPAMPLLGMYARELKSYNHIKTCTQIFTEAFIHNSPNVEAMQFHPQKMDFKMWSVHTIEYYPARKRDDVLMRATTWTNLKIIMLHASQSEKATYDPFI